MMRRTANNKVYKPKIPFGVYQDSKGYNYINLRPWHVYIRTMLNNDCVHTLETIEKYQNVLDQRYKSTHNPKEKQEDEMYLNAIIMIPSMQYFDFRIRQIMSKGDLVVLYGQYVINNRYLTNKITKRLIVSLTGLGKQNIHIIVMQKTIAGFTLLDDSGINDEMQLANTALIPLQMKNAMHILVH